MKRLSIAVLFGLACGGINLPPDWQKPCGGHVTAALSSVTLASDCRVTTTEAARAGAADAAGAPCAPDSFACQNYCRQSSMQLQFGSTALSPAQIEIRAVRLVDPATGAVVAYLTSREPQQWSVDRYIEWGQTLSPSATVKATYKLSASEKIYGFSSSESRLAGGTTPKYIVEVDVAVDGEVRTLTIEASREPEVVT